MRRRWSRRLPWAILVLVVVPLVTLRLGVGWPLLRGFLNSSASLANLGLEVRGGAVRAGLLPGLYLEARDLELLRDDGVCIGLEHFQLKARVAPLLLGRVELKLLQVTGLHVDLPGGGGEADGGVPHPGDLLSLFSRLSLDEGQLEDLRVRVAADSVTATPALEAGLRRARFRVEGGGWPRAHVDELDLDLWSPDTLRLRETRAVLAVTGEAIEMESFVARLEDTELGLSGRLESDGTWAGSIRLGAFEFGLLRPWIDSGLTHNESHLSGAGRIWGSDGSVFFAGHTDGFAGPVAFDVDTVETEWDGREILIHHGRGVVDGMRLAVESAAIEPNSQDYRLKTRLVGVDLSEKLPWLGPNAVSGDLSLTGSHFGGDELWLEVEVEGCRGELFELPLTGGSSRFGYALREFRVDEARLEWEGIRSDFWGRIGIPPDSAWVELESRAWVEPGAPMVARYVPLDSLELRLRVDGRLSGVAGAPALALTYTGAELNYGPVSLTDYRGEALLDSLFTHPEGSVTCIGGPGSVGVLPVDQARLDVGVHGRHLELRDIELRRNTGLLAASGSMALGDTVHGELATLAIDSREGGGVASGPVVFRQHGGTFTLERSTFHLAQGIVRVGGQWSASDGFAARYMVRDLDLDRLTRLLGGPRDRVNGQLSASGPISGTFASPGVRGGLDIRDFALGPVRLGRVQGHLELLDGVVLTDSLWARNDSLRVTLRGSYPVGPHVGWYPSSATTDRVDLDVWVESVGLSDISGLIAGEPERMGGEVDAEVGIRGRLSAPEIEARGNVAELAVLGDSYGDGEFALRVDAGACDFRAEVEAGARVEGTLPLEVCLAPVGVAPGDESMAVLLSVDRLDLAFLRHLVPDVASASGELSFEGALTGHLPWPDASGDLTLEHGQIQMAWMDIPLRNLFGRARVEGNWVSVTEGRGTLGPKGVFRTAGTILTHQFVPVDYHLNMSGERLSVNWFPDLRAEVDADLEFTRNAHIAGQVLVHEAVYSRPFGQAPRPLPPPILPGERASDYELSYSIRMTADKNVWIRNTEAQMELRGSATMASVENPTLLLPFSLLGEMEVIRGTYTLLGKNRFKIEEGEIQMRDPYVLDPEMEVRATAQVRERVRSQSGSFETNSVPIELELAGKIFSDLTYEFRDNSSAGGEIIPTEDVVLLLTFGRRRAAVDQGGLYDTDTALADAGAITAQLLEARVRELLDITVDIGTGTVSPFESLDDTYVGLGKYISDKLFVYYSQYLSADPRRKLGVEYGLSDHVLLSGELDETDLGDTKYNVDLRYRLEY